MATSQARIEANRRNAQKSTGPRTEAGKTRSRGNALTHGLTGAGVVLPGEDQQAVTELFEGMVAHHAPDGDPMAVSLSRKFAVLTVRGERAFRHESARAADRVRNAEVQFDEDRRALADHLYSHIGMEPATFARRLRAMPEGVDLLIGRLRRVRAIAEGYGAESWQSHHASLVDVCLGLRPGARPVSRVELLSMTLLGTLRYVDHRIKEEDEDRNPARLARVREEMVAAIDEEIARLEADRDDIDHDAIAVSRAEAGNRALIDTSAEGVLLRKYETANDRAYFRAIVELKRLSRERADSALPTAPPQVFDPAPDGPAPDPVGFVFAEGDPLGCTDDGPPVLAGSIPTGAATDPATATDDAIPDGHEGQPAPPPLFPRPVGATPTPRVDLPRVEPAALFPDVTRIEPTEVALGKRLGSFFPEVRPTPEPRGLFPEPRAEDDAGVVPPVARPDFPMLDDDQT